MNTKQKVASGKRCLLFYGGFLCVLFSLHYVEKASANDYRLAARSVGNTIELFDLLTANPFLTFVGHTQAIKALEGLSPHELASAALDHSIKLWDVKTQVCTRTLLAHTGAVLCLKLVSSQHLASGSADRSIRVWNTANGECIRHFADAHSAEVLCLEVVSSDGRRLLASGSVDRSIKLWSVERNECVGTVADAHSHPVTSLRQIAYGALASASSLEHTIKLWDVHTLECIRTLVGHASGVLSMEVVGAGRLASGSNDAQIKIWNVANGECEQNVSQDQAGAVSWLQLDVDKDRRHVYSGSALDGRVMVWRKENQQFAHSQQQAVATQARFGNSVFTLLIDSASNDNTVVGWLHASAELLNLRNQLAGGSGDSTLSPYLRVWNVDSAKSTSSIDCHLTSGYRSLLLLSGKRLVSGGGDGRVSIWDMRTGERVQILRGHKNLVRVAVALRGERQLVTGSQDTNIRIWRLRTSTCIRTLTGHTDAVTGLVVVVDESVKTVRKSRLISASRDGYIHMKSLTECAIFSFFIFKYFREVSLTVSAFRNEPLGFRSD